MHAIKILIVLGLGCTLDGATEPLANITTSNGVKINGKDIPQKTAPTWPVVANDEVATTANSAVLMVYKQDRASMAPKTSVKMESSGGTPALRLSVGLICLRVTKESLLEVFASNEQLSIPHPFEGTVLLNAPGQKATVKAGRCHFPVIPVVAGVAGAAAAATGAAVAVASPSR